MADLTPHPLVLDVASQLAQNSVGTLRADAVSTLVEHMPDDVKTTVKKARDKQAAASGAAPGVDNQVLAAAVDQADAGEQNAFATAFANQANVTGMSLFAGFLGAAIRHEDQTWRLVYLDSRLSSWMLVPEDAIIVWQRLPDENAPSGERDVLWVDSTANLITGNGPRANDGRFLVGSLTRAGDYAPSATGGTFSAASGILCEATTPGCCMYTRTRC